MVKDDLEAQIPLLHLTSTRIAGMHQNAWLDPAILLVGQNTNDLKARTWKERTEH